MRPEFAEENKENILKVMAKLREKPIEGVLYSSYTLEDGCTFIHINMARDAETLARLREVKEFTDFHAALKASQPTAAPVATDLRAVGAGFVL